MATLPTRRRLLAAAASATGLAMLGTLGSAHAAERVVKIAAKKFEYLPSEVSLKLGQPVVFELTTFDVMMGFSVYALGLRSDIVPGRVTSLRFTPDRVGRFELSCDVFCGDGHEDMSGMIIVTE